MFIDKHIHEKIIFQKRLLTAFIFILVGVFALIVNIGYLQITQHEKYSKASLNNRIITTPLTPTRGLIYDRNRKLLTNARVLYSLELIKENSANVTQGITKITSLIQFTAYEISIIKKLLRQYIRPFSPIVIKYQLTHEETAILAVNLHQLPGFTINAKTVRHYPYADVGAHVLGYIGLLNQQELNKLRSNSNYRSAQYIGKSGVEKLYETELHGITGKQQIEVNARGKVLNRFTHTSAVAGKNLSMYLDINLQSLAYKLLKNRKGAVVAMEPSTGGIIAMVSNPSFNPNLFIANTDQAQLKAIITHTDKPLFNRATDGQYPPASTIKPFIAIAGLDTQTISIDEFIYDPGWYELAGEARIYHDWKKRGHGKVNIVTALIESCDTYFYELGFRLGIVKMNQYLTMFGFGTKQSADIQVMSKGLLPSKNWKLNNQYSAWVKGDNLNTAIGQGFLLVTPLQLATATAAIANRGKLMPPRLVQAIGEQHHQPQAMVAIDNFTNWDTIIESMKSVMHSRKGTGYATGRSAKYTMAGKTGTAQVFSFTQEDGQRIDKDKKVQSHMEDHSLFIGFAPAVRPRIAIAVIIENGGNGSSAAAPLAKKIFDSYLADISSSSI
jgi:penicillin-binding protein 2